MLQPSGVVHNVLNPVAYTTDRREAVRKGPVQVSINIGTGVRTMKLPLARRVIAITGTCALQLLAACGGGGTGAADAGSHGPDSPPSSGPTPLPQEFDIRGEVFSFDAGMIANSPINLWVQTPGFGYSYWWAYEPLHSDGLGLFEARVPASEITLHAFKEGYVQPCAVRTQGI